MSDQMRILNKIDLSDLASIVGNSGESTKELITALTALIQILSEKKEPTVNFDVAALAQALGAMKQEIKAPDVKVAAPVIDLKPDINVPEPEPVAYEFTFKYGPNGRPVSATATPIRG